MLKIAGIVGSAMLIVGCSESSPASPPTESSPVAVTEAVDITVRDMSEVTVAPPDPSMNSPTTIVMVGPQPPTPTSGPVVTIDPVVEQILSGLPMSPPSTIAVPPPPPYIPPPPYSPPVSPP